MQNFSNYMVTLETYIMFQIKAKMLEMKYELSKKDSKTIALTMGAPVDMFPQFVADKQKEHVADIKNKTYTKTRHAVPFS